jgi:hypothetical protein
MDIIDSRDIIARIEELSASMEELADNAEALLDLAADIAEGSGEGPDGLLQERDEALATLADDWDELRALTALQDQAEGYCPDWHHGETLIRESYFETYAQELAEDCGTVENTDTWPGRCIDWEQAARELKQDYTEVDYQGVSYYVG